MENATNPGAALRSAMRDLLSMFRGTLGDEAGTAALKTAVQKAFSEVTGPGPRTSGTAPKSAPRPAAKSPARKPAPAPKGEKKKHKPSSPSPGRLRQIAAMKEYWRRKKSEAEEKPGPAGGTTA